MTGKRWLFAGAVLLILAMAGTYAAGWLRPVQVVGAAIGILYRLDKPDLSDPAMIQRGAAHYDLVCARCHGSPDRPDRGQHLRLTPPAPTLHLRLADWPPEQLFRVVRDGIRNSAMPAWPAAGRKDEIWSMVAFLAVLPGMGVAEYRRMAGGNLPADLPGDLPDAILLRCVTCHGTEGSGGTDAAAFPRLDIQTPAYLADALTAFRDGHRASGFMQTAATALTEAEIERLARHCAGPVDPGQVQGQPPHIVTMGDRNRKIAACASCHGLSAPIRPEIPRLAGQDAGYLARQLHLFVREEFPPRGGGPWAALMIHAVPDLSEREIAEIVEWYAHQVVR